MAKLDPNDPRVKRALAAQQGESLSLTDSVLQGLLGGLVAPVAGKEIIETLGAYQPRSEAVRVQAIQDILKGQIPFVSPEAQEQAVTPTKKFKKTLIAPELEKLGIRDVKEPLNIADLLTPASIAIEAGKRPAASLAQAADIATDPFTYLGLGGAKAAAKIAPKLVKLFETIPRDISTIEKVAAKVPVDEGISILRKAQAQKGLVIAQETPLDVTEIQALRLRQGNPLVKEIWEASIGKTKYARFSPEVRLTLRQNAGEKIFEIQKASELADLTRRQLGNDPKILNEANKVLAGKTPSGIISKEVQQNLEVARKHVDFLSNDLREEILEVVNKMTPAQRIKYESRFPQIEAGGGKLPPESLADIIQANAGHYVKREYAIFQPELKYEPSAIDIDAAIKGFQADLNLSRESAAKIVKDFLVSKQFDFKSVGKTLKINQDSFIARKNLPEYLRNLMGEIKDPQYNCINTVRNIADAKENFKTFRTLDELGLFSDTPTATHTVKIPDAGSLAYGVANGKYTTPEIGELLDYTLKASNVLDSGFMRLVGGLKFTKTVLSPKAQGHNFLGNFTFAILKNNFPLGKNLQWYNLFVNELQKGTKSPIIAELIKNGVVGNEMTSLASDEMKWLSEIVVNPYGLHKLPIIGKIPKLAEEIGAAAMKLYNLSDQLFKAALYLKNTKQKGMSIAQAVDDVFDGFPNYAETTKLAQTVRTSKGGILFGNFFFTFRAEAHRILLNAAKDPSRRLKLGVILSSRAAWNSAVLAAKGYGLKEIIEIALANPEAYIDSFMNPTTNKLDLSTQYIDPFNTRGLFAPGLAMAGATGIHPLDYLLDFTQLSSDFGYSNLVVNPFKAGVLGKGKFGQELTPLQRVQETTESVLSTSFTKDIPRLLQSTEDTEATRNLGRAFGVDLQERNPKFLEKQLKDRLKNKIKKGEDIETLKTAIAQIGFDPNKLEQSTRRSLERKAKEKTVKEVSDIAKELGIEV